MIDREKVIKGLECCSAQDRRVAFCHEYDCPYRDYEECPENLMRDALALLKAQEPRVMTLEEVIDNSELRVVWVERRNGDIYAGIYVKCRKTVGGAFAIYFEFYRVPNNGMFSISNYGKSFRCWTSRPTDKQMEVTKWND